MWIYICGERICLSNPSYVCLVIYVTICPSFHMSVYMSFILCTYLSSYEVMDSQYHRQPHQKLLLEMITQEEIHVMNLSYNQGRVCSLTLTFIPLGPVFPFEPFGPGGPGFPCSKTTMKITSRATELTIWLSRYYWNGNMLMNHL